MDHAWWAFATIAEAGLSQVEQDLVDRSWQRFNKWLSYVASNDQQTYNAYIAWKQNEEILEQQRRQLALQESIHAQQVRAADAAEATARSAASTARSTDEVAWLLNQQRIERLRRGGRY